MPPPNTIPTPQLFGWEKVRGHDWVSVVHLSDASIYVAKSRSNHGDFNGSLALIIQSLSEKWGPQSFVPWLTSDRNRSTLPADERDFPKPSPEKKKDFVTIHGFRKVKNAANNPPDKNPGKWSLLCNFRSIQYLSRTSIKSKGAPAQAHVFAPISNFHLLADKKKNHTLHAVLSDSMKLQDCCLPWPQAPVKCGDTVIHGINMVWWILEPKVMGKIVMSSRKFCPRSLTFCWTRTVSLNYRIIEIAASKGSSLFAGTPRLIRWVMLFNGAIIAIDPWAETYLESLNFPIIL